jgi:PAS domain S-box-containing protein
MNYSTSVLVIEGSDSARLALRDFLESMGHRVFEATHGKEGLEVFRRKNPDIVLADLKMPEPDGLEFISELKNVHPHIPIIVMSGTGTLAGAIEAIRLGACDYLIKPIQQKEELELAISCALERLQLLAESDHYRKRLEEQVLRQNRIFQESSQRFQRLLESVTNYVYTVTIKDGQAAKTLHRAGCEKITGFGAGDYLADPNLWCRMVLEEDRPAVLEMTRYILISATSLSLEHRIRHKDGSIRWVMNTLVPYRNAEGTLTYYDGIISDITERKLAENSLRESESKFKDLFESLVDGLLVSEAETRKILMYNQTMVQMLGYSGEELGELNLSDIYQQDDLPFVMEHIEKLHQGPNVPFSASVKRKDGAVFCADIYANPITLGNRRCLLGSFRDITDHKVEQETLTRHNDNLAALRNIDLAINSSLDLQITLKVLLTEALKQLHVDAACILLLSPHSQILEYACGLGFTTDRISFTSVRMGESYAGRIALEQKSRVICDLESEKGISGPTTLIGSEGFKAYAGFPLVAKGEIRGVLEVYCHASANQGKDWLAFAEMLAGQAAIAVENSQLYVNLQRSHRELLRAYDTTIEGWSRALDFRDQETEGHSRRVTALTVRIAREMGIIDENLVQIRRGSLLHDIGKLGVPDHILLKPGTLTREEFEIMKTHTEIAFNLLSPIEFLRPALDIPYFHHEKWDGTGYPRGLKGEVIPLAARIFAIVDVWDALRSDRPYRPAWPIEKVRAHIHSLSGTHFDPDITKIVEEVILPYLV